LHKFQVSRFKREKISIQLIFGKAPKVRSFKNLGSQGWIPRTPLNRSQEQDHLIEVTDGSLEDDPLPDNTADVVWS
jgi:hypothetical protein